MLQTSLLSKLLNLKLITPECGFEEYSVMFLFCFMVYLMCMAGPGFRRKEKNIKINKKREEERRRKEYDEK